MTNKGRVALKITIGIVVVVLFSWMFYGIGHDNGWAEHNKIRIRQIAVVLEEDIEEASKVTASKVEEWLKYENVSPQDLKYVSWHMETPISKWDDPEVLDDWYDYRIDYMARRMKRKIVRNSHCSTLTLSRAARNGNAWEVLSDSVNPTRVDTDTQEFLAFRHHDFGIRAWALIKFKDSLNVALVEQRLYVDLYPNVTDKILEYYELPERAYIWALDYVKRDPEYGEWIVGGLVRGKSPDSVLSELADMRMVEARRALARSERSSYEQRKRLVGDKNIRVVSALASCSVAEADILTKTAERLMSMNSPTSWIYDLSLKRIANHDNSPEELRKKIVVFLTKDDK